MVRSINGSMQLSCTSTAWRQQRQQRLRPQYSAIDTASMAHFHRCYGNPILPASPTAPLYRQHAAAGFNGERRSSSAGSEIISFSCIKPLDHVKTDQMPQRNAVSAGDATPRHWTAAAEGAVRNARIADWPSSVRQTARAQIGRRTTKLCAVTSSRFARSHSYFNRRNRT